MRKIQLTAVAALLAAPAIAFATSHDSAGSSSAGDATFEGVIDDVEEDEGVLSIDIRANEGVEVTRDGKSVSFEDLRDGDHVRARYDEASGGMVEIEATSKQRRRELRRKDRP